LAFNSEINSWVASSKAAKSPFGMSIFTPSHISLKLGLKSVTFLYSAKFLFLGSTRVGILSAFALFTTNLIIAGVMFPLS
jgi:hypothetical protein